MICAACGQEVRDNLPRKCNGCNGRIAGGEAWNYVKVRGVCTPMHVNCVDGERNGQ